MISHTAAGRYAQALYDAALDKGLSAVIDGELALIGAELQQNSDFRMLLTGRAMSMTEKKELLTTVYGDRMQQLTLNFLCLVIDKARERWLPDIIETYHQLYIEEQGLLQARLITPAPAAPELQQSLAAALGQSYGKKLEFACATDPALLGGAVVKIKDQVIDMSLKKQFQLIREEMLK